jgi:hypothetical protein
MSHYYYGQGKVFLARRNAAGQPLSWRWVGDVSSLTLELEFEDKNTKVSVGGQLVPAQHYITAVGGKVTSTWHELLMSNLELVLNSKSVIEPFSINEVYQLPVGIVKGDIFSLPHTTVFNVEIIGLENNVHYKVDPQWGMIEFLTTPGNIVYQVNYEHIQNQSIPLFTSQPVELSLRYHGLNIAEGNTPVLVELYRVVIEPLATFEFINTDDGLAGIETTAQILADLTRKNHAELGYFGRIQVVNPLSKLTYSGEIIHDGTRKYRGY